MVADKGSEKLNRPRAGTVPNAREWTGRGARPGHGWARENSAAKRFFREDSYIIYYFAGLDYSAPDEDRVRARSKENAMASATAGKRAQGKSDGGPPSPKHNVDAVRGVYYDRISKFDMAPLWKVMKSVVTKEPVTRCAPVIWHYEDVKWLVLESGGLISAEEAQRRVLILENPAMRGESRATNTMFAGIQMILPGEVAPVHRHVSAAIRFVLDGEGAYTAVEGAEAF